MKICLKCTAFHFAAERTTHLSIRVPQFSECCRRYCRSPISSKAALAFPSHSYSSRFCQQKSQTNIRVYNNALAMGCVKAHWVCRVPGSSSFNPAMTVHGRIYHFHGPIVFALITIFFSTSVHSQY